MPAALGASSPSCGSVLVVDDEPSVRNLLGRWLSTAGYTCSLAGDARTAWKHLEAATFDCVTLDVNMPQTGGVDLLRRIKECFPDSEVVMVTASGDTQTAIEALTAGASSYLLKPIEAEELLFQVRRALERRQLILERRQYTRDLESKVQEQTIAIRRAHEETILRLVSASMYRDEETGAHIRRTGLYCEVLAQVLGWPSSEIESIRLAAPMHDVGKIGIPDAILQKPGKLTPEEFEVMKTHTSIGARMLSGSVSPMLQMAEKIALCHHERWDGRGYPAGLSGDSIPETARIVSIVDVYDALTHDRVYRPAMSETDALELMEQQRGKQFDPFLFGVFLGVRGEMRRIALENPDLSGFDVSDIPTPEVLGSLCALQKAPQ